MNKGITKDYSFYSTSLKEELELMIYLPKSFSPLYKYNLLIVQDGRDYFQLGRITSLAAELSENHEISNTIIVGIPYKDIEDRYKKYHPEGENNNSYIRFLAHELVPFLDSEYPTYQMGLGRILLGDSLAATVSLMAALDYPHTFGKVILQSPYVNETVLSKVNHFEQSHLIDIYHVVGTQETDVPTRNSSERNFIESNRMLSKAVANKKFPYFYDEFEGDHTWTYWQPDLKRALMQMIK